MPCRGLPLGAPALVVSTDHPKQGETVEVSVPGSLVKEGEAPPMVEFEKQSLKLFPFQDGTYRALLTVPVVMKPGVQMLKVGDLEQKIVVVDAKNKVQYLHLPPSKNNFDMAKGEEEAVDNAKATLSDKRFWAKNFNVPSKARVSAGFGLRRVVNGKLLDDYFHSGLDFAGFQGSPIVACAPGTVVLAVSKGFKLHGNTVAIDHGQGVISFYIHMQKVLVKDGQIVKAGEQIGTVGQTGRANGPHLHFSIYCNKVASNPWQWFKSAPL